MKKLTVLDLFSGIGGFSLGLERSGGFETTAFCEIDEHARKVLHKHWPGILKFKDIKHLSPEEGDYDIICGGFPCQDISVAGKQKGLSGERSGLWREFHRVIKEVQPRYTIIENVANLRSKGLSKIIQDLWEIGYSCEWHIIPASAVGALHKRERIWIIAYPDRSKLREQSRRRRRKKGENKVQSRVHGEEGLICNSSSKRLNGRIGKERHLQVNEKRDSEKIQPKGQQCQPEPWEDGQILSSGAIERIRDSYSGKWELVSRVHRVVNGLSKEMERARKQRIKQLGNSVVPQIPELIGRAILEFENWGNFEES